MTHHNTEVSVLAWNMRDALSDEARANDAIDFIKQQDADIVILTEAYRSSGNSQVDTWDAYAAREYLRELDRAGYGITALPQEMMDRRPDQHAIAVAAKDKHVLDMRAVPLHARYAIRTLMRDPITGREYTVFGHHGNDKSENHRVRDVQALGRLVDLDTEDGMSSIVAGDLNTMSPNTSIARALRLARPLARVLPKADPDPDSMPMGLTRVGSLADRLTGMASGRAMRLYNLYGLYDVDRSEQPTMKKAGLAVKLDHILASGDFALLTGTFKVAEPTYTDENGRSVSVSDHRAIQANLRLLDFSDEEN